MPTDVQVSEEFQALLMRLGLVSRSPSLHYWQAEFRELEKFVRAGKKRREAKKDSFVFAYTTERVDGKSFSVVYRSNARTGRWKLWKKRGFVHRAAAKRHAYKAYQKRVEKLEERGVELR